MMETTAALLLMISPSYAAERSAVCKPFSTIYADGRALCENMWDGAFRYETKEEEAYTMWFFDGNNNPNDAITETLTNMGLITGVLPGEKLDQCYLAYFHKDGSQQIDNGEHPSEEPENFQECHPWSERSCCFQETVETADKLNKAYGPGFHWDRCGPLSPACERFFVQEACFYECEPNIGLYRKYVEQGQPQYEGGDAETYNPACDPYALEYNASLTCDHNTWQVSGMPIKASYCDAWWLACRDDYFCAHDGGSYFSCAEEYEENNPPLEEGRTASPTPVAFPSVAPTAEPTASAVIRGTVVLSGVALSDFLHDDRLQSSFKADIAGSAGVPSSRVKIVGLSSVSGSVGYLEEAAEVEFEIALHSESHAAAEDIKAQIGGDSGTMLLSRMSSYAAEYGYGTITGRVTIVKVVDTKNAESPTDEDKTFSSTELTITAVVCFFGAVALTVVFMTRAKKTQETSMRSREDSVRSDKSNDSNSQLMGKEKDGEMEIELFEQAVIVGQAAV
jgi:folate receptor